MRNDVQSRQVKISEERGTTMRKRLIAIMVAMMMVIAMPCAIFAEELPTVETDSTKLVQYIDNQISTNSFARIYGSNRYNTAFNVAEYLLARGRADSGDSNWRFNIVVVSSGENYPDALGAGPLAYIAEAPILLTNASYEKDLALQITTYLLENSSNYSGVYMIGGTGVVSSKFESYYNQYRGARQQSKRIAGANRYSTNLATLQLIDANQDDEILICSGTGFADSLSASATGWPIMLVGTSLTYEQQSFIRGCSAKRITIIGGTGAVNSTVENQVRSNAKSGVTVRRIAGANRYDTSYKIASTYFPNSTDVVLAYGDRKSVV